MHCHWLRYYEGSNLPLLTTSFGPVHLQNLAADVTAGVVTIRLRARTKGNDGNGFGTTEPQTGKTTFGGCDKAIPGNTVAWRCFKVCSVTVRIGPKSERCVSIDGRGEPRRTQGPSDVETVWGQAPESFGPNPGLHQGRRYLGWRLSEHDCVWCVGCRSPLNSGVSCVFNYVLIKLIADHHQDCHRVSGLL